MGRHPSREGERGKTITFLIQGGDMAENSGGMTEEEARAFHGYFIVMFALFVAAAAGAHLLAWSWRPWF